MRIENPLIPSPQWDINYPVPEVRNKVAPFQTDSIQDARKAVWAWGSLSPEMSGALSVESRPKLEAPSFDPRKLPSISEEIANNLIPKTPKGGETDSSQADPNRAEILLFLLYVACMKAQNSNQIEGSSIAFESIKKIQENNKQLMKDYFNKKDEKISRGKTNKILKWVRWSLWAGIGITGGASIALTIVTAGAALPAVLTVLNGALSAGSGALSITQGVVKHKDDKATAELTDIETERYLNTDRIRREAADLDQSKEVIAKGWEELSEALSNLYIASLNR